MSGSQELELPDDFDLAESLWQSLKGPEVSGTEDTKADESIDKTGTDTDNSAATDQVGEEVDAEQHTRDEGEMATGSSDQGEQTVEPSGHRADAGRRDGDTGGGEAEDRGTTTVTVTTVRPTSDDTAPAKPESDTRNSVKRRGPRFKNHRRRSSQPA